MAKKIKTEFVVIGAGPGGYNALILLKYVNLALNQKLI